MAGGVRTITEPSLGTFVRPSQGCLTDAVQGSPLAGHESSRRTDSDGGVRAGSGLSPIARWIESTGLLVNQPAWSQ